jgi:hypothetical protein
MIAVLLLLNSCAEFEVARNTDLAIDTYAPPPDALDVAETRAKNYWSKHQEEIGRDTRYLAVQSEIPNLYGTGAWRTACLAGSRVSASEM